MSANPLKEIVTAAASPQTSKPKAPPCPLCQNRGFVNCPEAITPRGDLIFLAFRQAQACFCRPWGSWFSEMQKRFIGA